MSTSPKAIALWAAALVGSSVFVAAALFVGPFYQHGHGTELRVAQTAHQTAWARVAYGQKLSPYSTVSRNALEASHPDRPRVAAAARSETPESLLAPQSNLSVLGILAVVPAFAWAVLAALPRRSANTGVPLLPLKQGTTWNIATTIDIRPEGRKLFRMDEDQKEVVKSMSDFAVEKIMPLATDPAKNWQPQDLLPDPQAENFEEEVKELRERALLLPDEYLVVLAGDMITEEALPTYMTMLNTLEGTKDHTGADATPWATWTRKWTAEENRHGDALNKYMYLSGRVDMKSIEATIQRLVGSGMDPGTDNNPYLGFIYTSFQERATKVSHGNTARMAKEAGDIKLAKMCGLIAADEGRHEQAYQRIVAELFRLDPNGTMLALEDMLRKQITMPAHLMDDGEHRDKNGGRSLFSDYAAVAEKLQVYTANDYTDIVEHLIKVWGVDKMTGLSEEAQRAQDYVCKLPARYRKLAARVSGRKKTVGPARFSWINDRELIL